MDKETMATANNDEQKLWTVNFDLDTKNLCYDNKHYNTIHKYLESHEFEYRQHSGDIATTKMYATEMIQVLTDFHNDHPDIKECTKSCLFTSVGDSYSFTELRKEQENIEPSKDKFDIVNIP